MRTWYRGREAKPRAFDQEFVVALTATKQPDSALLAIPLSAQSFSSSTCHEIVLGYIYPICFCMKIVIHNIQADRTIHRPEKHHRLSSENRSSKLNIIFIGYFYPQNIHTVSYHTWMLFLGWHKLHIYWAYPPTVQMTYCTCTIVRIRCKCNYNQGFPDMQIGPMIQPKNLVWKTKMMVKYAT